MNGYVIALLVYSVLLMALGLYIGKKVKSSSDFLVAGRSLGPGRIFATFLAANIGAGSTVGAAGLGYRYGLAAWWWVGSASIGSIFLAQFLGPKLWRIAQQHQLTTLPAFLDFRYGRTVRLTIAVLFWFGALSILAGQLIAISWILSTVAGVPKWEGCVIGGAVAMVYCVAGGLLASSFVNMFELAVTMSGLVLAVPFAIHAVGGFAGIHAGIAAVSGPAVADAHFSLFGAGAKQTLAWIAILLPSFMISPGLVQKSFGARDTRSVRIGVTLNAIGQAGFAFVPPLLGLCALAALPHLGNSELALPSAMKLLLPKWLSFWTLASIFSAELSATDAILFMLSTSLAVDFYKALIKPDVSPEGLLKANRFAMVGAAVVGVLLAIALPSIISAVSIFYGLIAVSLFIPMLAGIYTRSANTATAMISIVCALATTVAAMQWSHTHNLGLLSPQALGILAAAVVTLVLLVAKRSASSSEKQTTL